MKVRARAILKTLVYADLFDYPLTVKEILRLLIVEDKRLSPQLNWLAKDLKELQRAKKICNYKDYFAIRPAKKLVDLRTRRLGFANSKRRQAKKISSLLIKLPFVKLVGLTGSVAFDNAKVKDDIDLLIVTASNRLWLARFLVVIVLELLGKRRRPESKKTKDKICLNLFLTQDSLALPEKRRNLFTAHELGQLEVLGQKENTYAHFLKANLWVKRYLPNVFSPYQKMVALKESKPGKGLALFDWLENLAFKFQLVYMRKRKRSEWIGQNFAFFHPGDMSKKVIKDFNHSLFRLANT